MRPLRQEAHLINKAMDRVDKVTRSQVMSTVRSKNTRLEEK